MVGFLSCPCVDFHLDVLGKFEAEEDVLAFVSEHETHELFDPLLGILTVVEDDVENVQQDLIQFVCDLICEKVRDVQEDSFDQV